MHAIHSQADIHQHASRPTGQHTQPGRHTPACITTHRATHTARQTYVHQHASRPTGQHTQPGRHTYTSMHHDPPGNTHSQADIRTPACITQTYVHQHASRPTGKHTQPGRCTYTSMHHDPQGNTHSQADIHTRPTGQHTQPGRHTYTSMHHDPQGNTHSLADIRTPACITTQKATLTAGQMYVHQHASRPTGQHTARQTYIHDPQGNTHSQADIRTPACIRTHRATHTARQTYVHQHASQPTGQHTARQT